MECIEDSYLDKIHWPKVPPFINSSNHLKLVSLILKTIMKTTKKALKQLTREVKYKLNLMKFDQIPDYKRCSTLINLEHPGIQHWRGQVVLQLFQTNSGPLEIMMRILQLSKKLELLSKIYLKL